MTDEKLDALLRASLQSDEKAPAFHIPKKLTHVHRWVSGLAALCACAVLCVGAFVVSRPQPETAMKEAAAAPKVDGAPAMGAMQDFAASTESVVTEEEMVVTEETSATCAYPTWADAAAKEWMAVNAPDAPYELLAESERYCSYFCAPAEGERLYLVLDKETGEPVSLQQLLDRCNTAVNAKEVNMLYVNEKQELILVQGTEEILLGPVE